MRSVSDLQAIWYLDLRVILSYVTVFSRVRGLCEINGDVRILIEFELKTLTIILLLLISRNTSINYWQSISAPSNGGNYELF